MEFHSLKLRAAISGFCYIKNSVLDDIRKRSLALHEEEGAVFYA